jgi:uroporphyrinogen-III synthase
VIQTAELKKVLITRSHEGNEELARRLNSFGLQAICADVLSFAGPKDWSRVDDSLHRLGTYDWVVLTSATGARLFAERMRLLHLSRGESALTKVAAVGSTTSRALAGEGWPVDFVPTRFLTRSLAQELPGRGSVLLLRADVASDALGKGLVERGFEVDDVILYRTVRQVLKETQSYSEADVIVFGSPSAVEGLCSQVPREVLSNLISKEAFCVGPVTEKAARAHGFTRVVRPANSYTFDSVIEELRALHGLA